MTNDMVFRMVWRRNFLYLICLGTILASVIFFNYRDEAITIGSHTQNVQYYARGEVLEGIQRDDTYMTDNHLNNRRIGQGTSITSNLLHQIEPSYQSRHQLYRNATVRQSSLIELTATKNFSEGNLFTRNSSDLMVIQNSDSINASAGNYTAKSLSLKYSRVFQWNDMDPEGWKDLPISIGGGDRVSKTERVVFNRVGKCGSRSMISLLRDLAQQNNFNLISSIVYSHTHIPKTWEKHIVSVLDKVQTPYLFQRHLHYVNFNRYNASEVLYINIIREPIPRLVSHYYFSRFGDGAEDVNEKRARWPRSQEEFNETIDECTVNQHRDCSGNKNFYIIPFFCGNNRHCTSPSRRALLRAIYNVEKNFLVVGILEEFELTLKVLERMLPRYFSGAEKLYRTPDMASNASRTATNLKIPPSNETIRVLRRNMQYEYEFYEYIKKRLHKQKDELGL